MHASPSLHSVLLFAWLVIPSVCLRGGPVEFATPMLDPSPFTLWDVSLTLHGSGGHKDNPTYAGNRFREPSSFAGLGADLTVFRLPTDGNHFFFTFSGDDRRYFDALDVRKEQTFLSLAQFQHESGDWSWFLTGQHFFADQVLDLSDQSLGSGFARAAGHNLSLLPALRRQLGDQWWLQAGINLARQYYGGVLDDYWEYTPRLTLGKTYGHQSSLEFSLSGSHRAFDNSALLNAGGGILPGSHEELTVSGLDFVWGHYWDAGRHWRTRLKGAAQQHRDNGEGYEDFDRLAASAEVLFTSGRWQASLSGSYKQVSYAVQPGDAGGAGSRRREEIDVEVRLEYQLRPKLKLILDGELELSFANVSSDIYTARTVSLGLEWEL